MIDDLGLGGTQRQLVELLKGLPRARYDSEVISLSTVKMDYAAAIGATGIPLRHIPQSGAWDMRCFLELVRLLRQRQPAIVHTWLFTADLYGRLAAWVARVPIVISAVRSVEPDKPWHYVLADRALRRLTDAFTVNARAIGEVLQARERVEPAKIHTIYNGLDLASFDPARVDGLLRRQLGVDHGTPLIGIVGRLSPVKDHATFLRAAALVSRDVPAAQFLIAGAGPLRAELERQTRALDLDGAVRFLEGRADVAEVFASLDMLVVSSRYEGCCNVILEAMAMAKPVIATAIGGNPELVADGQTGRLVPVGDDAALASAITELIRDPQRAQAMGQAGRRAAESRFDVRRMVEETDRLYQHLLTLKTRNVKSGNRNHQSPSTNHQTPKSPITKFQAPNNHQSPMSQSPNRRGAFFQTLEGACLVIGAW